MIDELIEQTGSEKREYPRFSIQTPVRYRHLNKEESEKALGRYAENLNLSDNYEETQTLNVSKNGLAVYTNEELPAKSLVAIKMHISIPGLICNCNGVAEVIRRDVSANEQYQYLVALKLLRTVHQNLKDHKFSNLNNLLDINDTAV